MQKISHNVSVKSSVFTSFFARMAMLVLFAGFMANNAMAAMQAPDINLKKLDNTSFKLSDYRGDVLYVDFWATWCPPCRKSFPWMEEMHQRYKDLGFKVIAVSTDVKSSLIDHFLKDLTTNFIIAHDPEGEAATVFKVSGMPSSYLIDRKGNIQLIHKGFASKDKSKLEEEIKKLVATD